MALEYTPLLKIQREVYEVPLGAERFKTYVNTILNSAEDNIELTPLSAMNPMAKDHALACLDTLLEQHADTIATEALTEFQSKLKSLDAFEIRASLVLCDDLKGGWTNRTLNEFSYCFEFDKSSFLKRPWLMIPYWTSDDVKRETVRETTLAYLYRLAYVIERGRAKTLEQMLKQEGQVLKFSDRKQWLDKEELEYTKAVLEPYLQTTEKPTQIACLYGDEAAKSVGYKALGLEHKAGFALALEQELGVGN
ncbi:MAG: hypothetical protein ACRCYY_17305 [Trueperaceae bacterium]